MCIRDSPGALTGWQSTTKHGSKHLHHAQASAAAAGCGCHQLLVHAVSTDPQVMRHWPMNLPDLPPAPNNAITVQATCIAKFVKFWFVVAEISE